MSDNVDDEDNEREGNQGIFMWRGPEAWFTTQLRQGFDAFNSLNEKEVDTMIGLMDVTL